MNRLIALAMLIAVSSAFGEETKTPAPIAAPQQNANPITHEDATAMVKTMKEINANLTAIRESMKKLTGEPR